MFFKELEMLNLVLSGLQHLQAAYQDWRRRQVAYDELSALDDRSLADIGITRADIPNAHADALTRNALDFVS